MTKENRTIVDICEERLTQIRAARDAENTAARAKIQKFTEEKAAIRKTYDKLKEQAESLAAEYLKLLEETKEIEEKAIKETAVTEEDLRAGRLTLPEFMKVGKKLAEIKAEAQEAAEKKLADARKIVRGLNLRAYEMKAKMAELDEKIQREYSFAAARFHYEIGAIKKTLEEHGVTGAGVEVMHYLANEAKNNLAMASRGVSLFSAKTWKVKNIAEAEAIVLDPIMQEEHLENLRKVIEEIRGREWAEATIFYTPSDIPGRPAGDIWHFLSAPRKKRASKVDVEIEVKS